MIRSWMAKDSAGLLLTSMLLRSSIDLAPDKKFSKPCLPKLMKMPRLTADQIENRPPVPRSTCAILLESMPKASALLTADVTAKV